ncbi:glycosyltransferase [bacterium]|nr:MAG: glycosyltransferase [bacterium]
MSTSGWVAYVGPMPFPWGSAGSRRMYGVASSLAAAGYRVVVGHGGHEPGRIELLHEDSGAVSHIGLGERPEQLKGRIRNIRHSLVRGYLTSGALTVRWLDSQSVRPTHVIAYGGFAPYMFRLLGWCRKNSIPLIADVVEWYDPSHRRGGYLNPFYLSAKFAFRFQYARCDGVIAISSFLEDYYSGRGCKVIRVPPTLNVEGLAQRVPRKRGANEPLTLVYAGSPGKKDLVGNVIKGLLLADPEGRRTRLLAVGPAREQILRLLGESGELPPNVVALGRLPQPEVAKILEKADFSVLLRPREKYAEAGFPTKFVESLAAGVPVIANITSDLGDYLHDGVEGLVCRDHSPEGFAEALSRAMALSARELDEMSAAARKRAEDSFDFRNFAKPLAAFLEELRS